MSRQRHAQITLFALSFCSLWGCSDDSNDSPQNQSQATIGVDGGELELTTSNGASLTIGFPPGALARNTELTLTDVSTEGSPWLQVRISPSGLELFEPVRLSASAPADVSPTDATTLILGTAEAPLVLETSLEDRVLTASTMTLGFASETSASGLRAGSGVLAKGLDAEDSSTVSAVDMSCEVIGAHAITSFMNLLQDEGLETAVEVHNNTLALAAWSGCDVEQEGYFSLVSEEACPKYESVKRDLANIEPLDYGALYDVLEELYYWAGTVKVAGESCADDFSAVADEEVDEYLVFYTGKLAGTSISEAELDKLRVEIVDLTHIMFREMSILGLAEQAQRIQETLIPQMASALREAAYRIAQDQKNTEYLPRITSLGIELPKGQSKGQIPDDFGARPYALGYSDQEIFDDINYVNNSVTLQINDIGDVVSEAVVAQRAALPGAEHQTEDDLELSQATVDSGSSRLLIYGPLYRLKCGVSALNDALRIDLRDSVGGLLLNLFNSEDDLTRRIYDDHLYDAPIEIDIDEMFRNANVTFSEEQAFEIAFFRERPETPMDEICGHLSLYGPRSRQLFSVTINGASRCPKVYDNGHNYRFCNQDFAKTWDEASADCTRQGGYLVAIDNAQEELFVKSELSSRMIRASFIGYTDQASEGNWVWSNGQASGYENWNQGEPNNEGDAEHCGEIIADAGWNDVSCDGSQPYICEIPL